MTDFSSKTVFLSFKSSFLAYCMDSSVRAKTSSFDLWWFPAFSDLLSWLLLSQYESQSLATGLKHSFNWRKVGASLESKALSGKTDLLFSSPLLSILCLRIQSGSSSIAPGQPFVCQSTGQHSESVSRNMLVVENDYSFTSDCGLKTEIW